MARKPAKGLEVTRIDETITVSVRRLYKKGSVYGSVCITGEFLDNAFCAEDHVLKQIKSLRAAIKKEAEGVRNGKKSFRS